jgi:membrane associated rhomboid family serine protease
VYDVTPWVLRLVIANVAVFGLQILMPGLAEQLVFVPRLALREPWTAITYMFLHGGVMHLLFNMLGLFWFGTRVEERLGGAHFAQLYFIAGITGALFQWVLAPNGAMVGASAGVFGVMMAYAVFWPKQVFLIWGVLPMQVWMMVALYTVWSVFSGAGGSRGGVADYAHLGGYAGAIVFLWALDRWSPANRWRKRVRSVKPETERALKQNIDKVNLDGVHAISREEVNRILDKISATGIGSLTVEEKLFLSNFVPPDDRKNWT